MSSADSGQLIQIIDTFTFRETAAISIPKYRREIAYTQSIDIDISSVTWSLYENSKCAPPLQFYGYASLVFEDNLSLEVPIHFPRQRIYSTTNWDALSQWRRLSEYLLSVDKWNDFFFNLFTGTLPEPPPKPPVVFPKPSFVELPLREVYVVCPLATQFDLEYTQYQPVPFEDDNSVTYDGKSQQKDGEKDDGLPSNGIQPKRNSPTDPYFDNKPMSVDLGGFNNSKLPNLNKVDPNNGLPSQDLPPATSDSEGFYIDINYLGIAYSDGRSAQGHIYYGCKYNSSLHVEKTGVIGTLTCGINFVSNVVSISGTSESFTSNTPEDYVWTGEVKVGLLPAANVSQVNLCA